MESLRAKYIMKSSNQEKMHQNRKQSHKTEHFLVRNGQFALLLELESVKKAMYEDGAFDD